MDVKENTDSDSIGTLEAAAKDSVVTLELSVSKDQVQDDTQTAGSTDAIGLPKKELSADITASSDESQVQKAGVEVTAEISGSFNVPQVQKEGVEVAAEISGSSDEPQGQKEGVEVAAEISGSSDESQVQKEGVKPAAEISGSSDEPQVQKEGDEPQVQKEGVEPAAEISGSSDEPQGQKEGVEVAAEISGSSDEEWKGLTQDEKRSRKFWKKQKRRGEIPPDQLPPWEYVLESDLSTQIHPDDFTLQNEPTEIGADVSSPIDESNVQKNQTEITSSTDDIIELPKDTVTVCDHSSLQEEVAIDKTEKDRSSDSSDDEWKDLPKKDKKLRKKWKKHLKKGRISKGQLPPWEGGPLWERKSKKDISSDSSDDEWKDLLKKDKKLRKKWKKQLKKGRIPEGQLPPWEGGPAWEPKSKKDRRNNITELTIDIVTVCDHSSLQEEVAIDKTEKDRSSDSSDDEWKDLPKKDKKLRKKWKKHLKKGRISEGQLPPWEGGPLWERKSKKDISSDSSDDEWKDLLKKDKKLRKKWKKQLKKGRIPEGQLPPWEGGPAWEPKSKKDRRSDITELTIDTVTVYDHSSLQEVAIDKTEKDRSSDSSDDEWKDLPKKDKKLRKKWKKHLKKGRISEGQLPPWEGGPLWERKSKKDISSDSSEDEWKDLLKKDKKLRKKWKKQLKKGRIPEGQLPPWKGGPAWEPKSKKDRRSDIIELTIDTVTVYDHSSLQEVAIDKTEKDRSSDSSDDEWKDLPKKDKKLRKKWKKHLKKGRISEGQLPPWEGGPLWERKSKKDISSDSSDDEWKDLLKKDKKLRKKWKKQLKKGRIPEGQLPPWEGGPAWEPKGKKDRRSDIAELTIDTVTVYDHSSLQEVAIDKTEKDRSSDSSDDEWKDLPEEDKKLRKKWKKHLKKGLISEEQLPPWEGGPEWNPEDDGHNPSVQKDLKENDADISGSSDDEWKDLPKSDKRLRKIWKKFKKRGIIAEDRLPPWEGGPEWDLGKVDISAAYNTDKKEQQDLNVTDEQGDNVNEDSTVQTANKEENELKLQTDDVEQNKEVGDISDEPGGQKSQAQEITDGSSNHKGEVQKSTDFSDDASVLKEAGGVSDDSSVQESQAQEKKEVSDPSQQKVEAQEQKGVSDLPVDSTTQQTDQAQDSTDVQKDPPKKES